MKKLLCCTVSAVNDSLDDILGESGDEEEEDAVVSQVLDEIGIEISGKVCTRYVLTVSQCGAGLNLLRFLAGCRKMQLNQALSVLFPVS